MKLSELLVQFNVILNDHLLLGLLALRHLDRGYDHLLCLLLFKLLLLRLKYLS